MNRVPDRARSCRMHDGIRTGGRTTIAAERDLRPLSTGVLPAAHRITWHHLGKGASRNRCGALVDGRHSQAAVISSGLGAIKAFGRTPHMRAIVGIIGNCAFSRRPQLMNVESNPDVTPDGQASGRAECPCTVAQLPAV